MLKQLLISLLFLFLLFFIRNIGSYSDWYEKRLLKSYEEIAEVRNIKDVGARRERRYRSVKTYESIKKYMSDSSKTDSANILLIPSNEYLKAANAGISLSEPAFIYYINGLRTVLPYTELSGKANWALVVLNKAPLLLPISSAAQRDSLIDLYRSYPYTY